MRICATHNCEIRNSGTATYALRALKLLQAQGVIEEAFHWMPRGEAPRADWYLYTDDGRDDLDWLPPHPWAYWAVDTHLGYGYRLWKALQADRVYVAQKDAVENFARDGVKQVQWLPLACHPEAHNTRKELLAKGFKNNDLTETWDWSFVGFMNNGDGDGSNNRIDYLDCLQRAFPNGWISAGVFFEDMAVRCVRAKLGFNISIKRDLNMRVFEIMSTGTALLTNRDVHGIDDLFIEGEDYYGFDGPDEMLARANDALVWESIRETIAIQALEKVRSRHTYEHRIKTIIEEMNHV